MRSHHRIIAAAATAALGLSSALMMAPAGASTGGASAPARPAPHSPFVPYAKSGIYNVPSGGYVVPTAGNGQWGATAEGVGVQVALTSNLPTFWNFVETQTNIWKIKPSGNSGHCWEQDGSALEIQNCAQGNGQQQFVFDGNGPANIQNIFSNAFVGVFNPNANKPLWVENTQNGFYITWSLPG